MANAIKRKQMHAYTEGMAHAVKSLLPTLEDKYRLRTTRNFWVIVAAVFAVAFAAGVAVGEVFL